LLKNSIGFFFRQASVVVLIVTAAGLDQGNTKYLIGYDTVRGESAATFSRQHAIGS